ncbi:MAG: aminopeptidase C [Candidatus Nanoarchaeia archaeon]
MSKKQTKKSPSLSANFLKKCKQQKKSKQQLAFANALASNSITEVALRQDTINKLPLTFSHELKTQGVTNQKVSGRCWLFAGLNLLRQQISKELNIPDFELSQIYLTFFDKFEKANWFLECIIDFRKKALDSREVLSLLSDPLNDGGHWSYFSNLVEKYGVIPKDVMKETYHSQHTKDMNSLFEAKLREYAVQLRKAHAANKTIMQLRLIKEKRLKEFYQLLVMFYGEPINNFDFEYKDKDEKFHDRRHMTPKKFYEKFVKNKPKDFVAVVSSAAHQTHEHFQIIKSDVVRGMQPVHFITVSKKEFEMLTLKQLKNELPVWFATDVYKYMQRKKGYFDADIFDYETVLFTTFSLAPKDMVLYRDIQMNHAMVFTGVNIVNQKPNRWKVENSWGDEQGHKGYYVAGHSWFKKYVQEVIIHKENLSDAQKKILKKTTKKLPWWSPLNSYFVVGKP